MNNSPSSITRWGARLLLLTATGFSPCVTQAQATALPATLSPTDQKSLEEARQLTLNEKACQQLLDWDEANASLGEVAAHIQTQLGKDAPSIEVRSTSALRATFTLTQAPLGKTLASLAKLASGRLWVFAKGVVIAPEAALSDEEVAAIKRHEGGDWMQSQGIANSSAAWSGRDAQNRASMRIVGADVKAHLAAKGQTEPKPLPAPPASTPRMVSSDTLAAPFELPFGELSPATQGVLQELLDAQVRFHSAPTDKDKPVPPIPPEAVVGFDDTQPQNRRLLIRGMALPTWQTQWYVNI